jgi:tetratricopeptide (TPR) repeat protein
MIRRTIPAILFAMLLTAASAGQSRCPQGAVRTQIQVRVYYDNGRPAGHSLRVMLTNNAFTMVDQQFTDSQGGVTFYVSGGSAAQYKLKITGNDIEETQLERGFEISPCQAYHYENVTVKLKESASPVTGGTGTVSEAELNIPDRARSEFEKGAKAMGKKDLEKARLHMTRATEIYPRYAEAFNVLGVIAMNTDHPDEGRAMFERAIQADDKHPAAYVNMAKILMGEKKFAEATAMVEKSVTLNPLNAESQSLLCYFQLMEGRLEDVVATAKRIHQLPHERFPQVHSMAAMALERLQRPRDAVEEYKLYVKEGQEGAQMERARAALASLEHKPK